MLCREEKDGEMMETLFREEKDREMMEMLCRVPLS